MQMQAFDCILFYVCVHRLYRASYTQKSKFVGKERFATPIAAVFCSFQHFKSLGPLPFIPVINFLRLHDPSCLMVGKFSLIPRCFDRNCPFGGSLPPNFLTCIYLTQPFSPFTRFYPCSSRSAERYG